MMKHARRTDCWFAGVAIVPAVLLFAGYPEAIFLLFLPLLIVACLFSLYEQSLEPSSQESSGNATSPELPVGAASRTTSGTTLKSDSPKS